MAEQYHIKDLPRIIAVTAVGFMFLLLVVSALKGVIAVAQEPGEYAAKAVNYIEEKIDTFNKYRDTVGSKNENSDSSSIHTDSNKHHPSSK